LKHERVLAWIFRASTLKLWELRKDTYTEKQDIHKFLIMIEPFSFYVS